VKVSLLAGKGAEHLRRILEEAQAMVSEALAAASSKST